MRLRDQQGEQQGQAQGNCWSWHRLTIIGILFTFWLVFFYGIEYYHVKSSFLFERPSTFVLQFFDFSPYGIEVEIDLDRRIEYKGYRSSIGIFIIRTLGYIKFFCKLNPSIYVQCKTIYNNQGDGLKQSFIPAQSAEHTELAKDPSPARRRVQRSPVP